MAIKKLNSGKYQLDFYPNGRSGPRMRRVFKTKKEAKNFEAECALRYEETPSRFDKDRRSLSELVDLWYRFHGITLKDAKYRYSRTLQLASSLGNPPVYQFTSARFVAYREQRLKAVSVATVNHELRYLRAVFSELKRLGQYHGDNPLLGLRTLPERTRELAFLTTPEIKLLLAECAKSSNTHCLPVTKLCLATGARWNEANKLTASCLLADRVVYQNTKNGKDRVVPIDPELSAWLRSVAYPVKAGFLFDSAEGAFRKAVARSAIELPPGQMTHVLRHTFASHFMMNGGDILTLQKVLGHSDLKVTMRYAHLSPDYMNKVVELNPLPR